MKGRLSILSYSIGIDGSIWESQGLVYLVDMVLPGYKLSKIKNILTTTSTDTRNSFEVKIRTCLYLYWVSNKRYEFLSLSRLQDYSSQYPQPLWMVPSLLNIKGISMDMIFTIQYHWHYNLVQTIFVISTFTKSISKYSSSEISYGFARD
jgi:hypothetical protein